MHTLAAQERTFDKIPITGEELKGFGFGHAGQLLAQPERLVFCAGRVKKPANVSIDIECRPEFG